MKIAALTALLAFLFAIALGLLGQNRPAAERFADQITAVPAAWYQALPQDPAQATQAFLERVPTAMRDRGEAVSRSRYWALAARAIANLGGLVLFLVSGAASALGGMAMKVTRYRWVHDLVFAFVLLVYLYAISLPVEVGASYIRYRAFGFSDQSFPAWLQANAIDWLTLTIFEVVGIALLMALIRRWQRSWFASAGLVFLALSTLYAALTPVVIEPLTSSFTPLPDGPLKHEILMMAREASVPASDIFTDDASHTSRRLNGHVSGLFGSVRVVIDDTALGSSPPAVEALAAHEMGHYRMGHPLKMVAVASVVATIGFALIALVAPAVQTRYGRFWRGVNLRDSSAIAIYWLLFVAWGFMSDPLTNAYARVQESQADAFSLNLARQPVGLAEFTLQDADIARLQPTLLDVVLFYDHPSDASRIEHAMRWRANHRAGG